MLAQRSMGFLMMVAGLLVPLIIFADLPGTSPESEGARRLRQGIEEYLKTPRPVELNDCALTPNSCRRCSGGKVVLRGYVQDRAGSPARVQLVAVSKEGKVVGYPQWANPYRGNHRDSEFTLELRCPYAEEVYLTNRPETLDSSKKGSTDMTPQYDWIRSYGVSWFEVLNRQQRRAYGTSDMAFLSPDKPEKLGAFANEAVEAPVDCSRNRCAENSLFRASGFAKGTFARIGVKELLMREAPSNVRIRVVLDYKRSGEELAAFCRMNATHELCQQVDDYCSRAGENGCGSWNEVKLPTNLLSCSDDGKIQSGWKIHPAVEAYLAKKHLPDFLFDNQGDCYFTHTSSDRCVPSDTSRAPRQCDLRSNPEVKRRTNTESGLLDDDTMRGNGGTYPVSLEELAGRSDLYFKCDGREQLVTRGPLRFDNPSGSSDATNKGLFARTWECDGARVSTSMNGCYEIPEREYDLNFSCPSERRSGWLPFVCSRVNKVCHNKTAPKDAEKNSYFFLKPTGSFSCGGMGPIYYRVQKVEELTRAASCNADRQDVVTSCARGGRGAGFGVVSLPTRDNQMEQSCRPVKSNSFHSLIASCSDADFRVIKPCLNDSQCGSCGFCANGACTAKIGGMCNNDRDCRGTTCRNGRCMQCSSDSECSFGQFCSNGGCFNGSMAALGGDYWKGKTIQKRKPWQVTTQGDYRIEYMRYHMANPHPDFPDHWGDTESVRAFVSEGYISHMHFKHHAMKIEGINAPAYINETKDITKKLQIKVPKTNLSFSMKFGFGVQVEENGPAVEVVPRQLRALHASTNNPIRHAPDLGHGAEMADTGTTEMRFASQARPQRAKVYVSAGSNASYHFPGTWVSKPRVNLRIILGWASQTNFCDFTMGKDFFRGNDSSYTDWLKVNGGYGVAPLDRYASYAGYLTPPIEDLKMPMRRIPGCRDKICNAGVMSGLCLAALGKILPPGTTDTVKAGAVAACVVATIPSCKALFNEYIPVPLGKPLGGGTLPTKY